MKNILIINGHPDIGSYCTQLALSYKRGAESSGARVTLLNLCELNFDPTLHHSYNKRTELEPDLLSAQKFISDANHIVMVYPNWWGTYPALLKGFIDRTFLPKFAFKYREDSLLWDKLLAGKTARIIVTMDTPKWYYNLFFHKPGHNSMKKNILEFCGIKPVKITSFSPMKTSDEVKRKMWITKVEALGKALK